MENKVNKDKERVLQLINKIQDLTKMITNSFKILRVSKVMIKTLD